MSEEGKKFKKSNDNQGFICESHAVEDDKLIHYWHNPVTGEWKKSNGCTK